MNFTQFSVRLALSKLCPIIPVNPIVPTIDRITSPALTVYLAILTCVSLSTYSYEELIFNILDFPKSLILIYGCEFGEEIREIPFGSLLPPLTSTISPSLGIVV